MLKSLEILKFLINKNQHLTLVLSPFIYKLSSHPIIPQHLGISTLLLFVVCCLSWDHKLRSKQDSRRFHLKLVVITKAPAKKQNETAKHLVICNQNWSLDASHILRALWPTLCGPRTVEFRRSLEMKVKKSEAKNVGLFLARFFWYWFDWEKCTGDGWGFLIKKKGEVIEIFVDWKMQEWIFWLKNAKNGQVFLVEKIQETYKVFLLFEKIIHRSRWYCLIERKTWKKQTIFLLFERKTLKNMDEALHYFFANFNKFGEMDEIF